MCRSFHFEAHSRYSSEAEEEDSCCDFKALSESEVEVARGAALLRHVTDGEPPHRDDSRQKATSRGMIYVI